MLGFKTALLLVLTSLAMSISSRPLSAQRLEEPVQEFFVAKAVYPQEKGETQITLRPTFLKGNDFDQAELGWKVEYGVSDRLEVELEMLYIAHDPDGGAKEQGLGNVELGFLYSFLPIDEPIALSATFEVELPSGDEAVAGDKAEWEALLILAKQLGRAQVHMNVGMEATADKAEFLYNLAVVVPLNRSFSLTTELNGVEVIEDTSLYFTPGIYFRPLHEEPLFEFGIGFPVALNGEGTPYGIVGKVTAEG